LTVCKDAISNKANFRLTDKSQVLKHWHLLDITGKSTPHAGHVDTRIPAVCLHSPGHIFKWSSLMD